MHKMASPKYRTLITSFIIVLAISTTTTDAINCPPSCKCSWVLDSLEVDCSHSGLIDYPAFDDMPIEHLDLSNNFLIEFPKQLADVESLIYLDLSDNQIEYLDSDSLLGFTTLRTLLLANNSIENWSSINPNELFRPAISLKHLSLSGNRLGSFTDSNTKGILRSESLIQLELERCDITTVGGDLLMNGLPNLERLILSQNSLSSITAMPSKSLRVLELSNCQLLRMNSYLLQGLPSLEALNLSWNSALQFDNLLSHSLNELDVSFCNLDEINLSGLPGLTFVRLRGNMLRSISASTFANNTQMEIVDLARNSLRLIEGEAFTKLKRLSKLDLSYNEIARLDRNLFRSNDVLVSLNLSRNVIEKFTKLVSNSLREISLSWCEILAVEVTAFSALSAIQSVDLSNNLIKDFPSGMRSETLQKLNLSNCRLSAIRNTTFREFPELASLRLNGNRFTNPFSSDYFRSNKFLDEIWVGDNPWICSCTDTEFMEFYDFLTAAPAKLKDKNNVRCASPSQHYGRTWEMACIKDWHPNGHTSSAGRVWTLILYCLLVIGVLLLVFKCFTKYMKSRKQNNNHREYRQNQEEMAEIRRQNQRMLQEDGVPNAPSGFETNLPSYEDAILMPKPERPIKSMVDLTVTGRARKKLQRTRTDPEEDIGEDEVDDVGLTLDNHQRFRSEEMLSNRDKERTAQIGPHRRTGRIEYCNSGSRRFSIEESRFPPAHLKSQNLQSAEQIGNFQSYENSPYTKRRVKIAEIPPFRRATLQANSVEFLTDPEYDAQSKPNSPFARRKPKTSSMPPQIPPRTSSIAQAVPDAGGHSLDPAIEDYFAAPSNKKSPSNSTDSDFQVLIDEECPPKVAAQHEGGYCPSSPSSSYTEMDLERGKRKKRKNSTSRRASGNFTAASVGDDSSSSDREPIVVVHKPMRETLF